jgi:hypothetical protein
MLHNLSVIEKLKHGFLLDKLTFHNTQVCIEKYATIGKQLNAKSMVVSLLSLSSVIKQ